MSCQLIDHRAPWPSTMTTTGQSRLLFRFASLALAVAGIFFDTTKIIMLLAAAPMVIQQKAFLAYPYRLSGPRLSCCGRKNGSESSFQARRAARDPKAIAVPRQAGGTFRLLLRIRSAEYSLV